MPQAAGTGTDRAGQIESILTPLTAVPQEARALAWDIAMDDALDEAAVTTRLRALPLPDDARAAIWDLRFAEGAAGPAATPAPSQVPAATRFSRVATPIMGSIVGGTKGFILGGPMGAVVGAGIGAGGAELLQTGFERVFPPTPDADQEARAGLAERLSREINAGMTGEMGGRVIGPILRSLPTSIDRLYQPFGTDLEPFAREAMELLTERTADGRIIRVLPGQVSTSRLADVAQNVAEQSIFGGRMIERANIAQQRVGTERVQQILADFGRPFGTGPTGRGVRGTMRVLQRRFQQRSNELWSNWRRLGGEVSTPTLHTDGVVADLLNIPAGELKSNTGLQAAQRWAARGGDESLEAIEEGIAARTRGFSPEQLASMSADSPALRRTLTEMAEARAATDLADIPTANAVQELISELGQIQDIAQRTLKGSNPTTAARQTKRIATLMKNALLEDIDQALGQSSDEAREAYDAARAFTRDQSAILRADPVNALMKELNTAPERVIRELVTKNNATQIEAVHTAIGDRAFHFIQTRALREIIEPVAATGEISWKNLLTRLGEGEGGLGANTLNALFPDGQAATLQRFARLMQQVQRNQGLGTGRMAIQLAQGGAVLGLVTGAGVSLARGDPTAFGASATTASVIFLGPVVLARILTNPRALRWLTIGVKAGLAGRSVQAVGRGARQVLDSPLAARAAGNLLSFMLTPEADAEGATPAETPGMAPGTTLRLDPARLGEISGVPGVRTGAQVSVGR